MADELDSTNQGASAQRSHDQDGPGDAYANASEDVVMDTAEGSDIANASGNIAQASGDSDGAVAADAKMEEEESVEIKEKERLRFEVELEFVQCLANPTYLNYLAQTLVLEDENFLAYLSYLRYWKEPEYAKFIVYPHCLYFLDLLQDKGFRTKLKEPQVTEIIHSQQFFHWQFNHATATHDQVDVRPPLAESEAEQTALTNGEEFMDTTS